MTYAITKSQERWSIDPTPGTPEDYETLVDLLYDEYPAEMGANDQGSKALLRSLQEIAEQSVECMVWTKQEANGNLIVIEWGGHPKYILATLNTLTGVYNPDSAEWDELIEQANEVTHLTG